MRSPLLIFIILAAVTIDGHAISPAGHFQQRLNELQRRGSCADLPQFGVGTHRGRDSDDINVKLVADVGARIVRLDLFWNEVEQNGQYTFTSYDHLIDALRRDGRTIVLVLGYGHPAHSDGRADSGFPFPPRTADQRAAYARYAQAVAEHYHGPDIAYEIWNEANLDIFWPPTRDPKAYASLLSDAAKAIRSVEPKATILLGGLANENNPADFVHALATAGALDQLDGLAFHPYRREGPENSLYDIAEFEKAASAGGNAHPLWITEWGYSEAWFDDPDPERIRQRTADMTARLMLTAALARAKALVVYDLIDDGVNSSDIESSFGLYDYDFRPKKAAAAFRTLAGTMAGCDAYEFKVDKANGAVTAAFYFPTTVIYVVWTDGAERSRDICFSAPYSRPIALTDVAGEPRPIDSCGPASAAGVRLTNIASPVIVHADRTGPN